MEGFERAGGAPRRGKGRRLLRVLGTMSGTSLDGVDAAVVITDGVRIEAFGAKAYRPYTEAERAVLRAALGRWPEEPGVAEAARVVEAAHAALCARFVEVDLVAFHGQTLAHEPGGRGTHQVGSGAVLAELLGLPVVWDFRSADVALGGQGAPLVPFFHHALACRLGAAEPLAFLNLGGVANVTWVDPRQSDPLDACLAFDCGPGIAQLDDLIRLRTGQEFDDAGKTAAEGRVHAERIEAFLRHPFFARLPPKSLDRAAPGPEVGDLSLADALATLAAAVAGAVRQAFEHFPTRPAALWVTGGGRRHTVLMRLLEQAVPCPVVAVDSLGLDGDMLEAQAFAFLAARVLAGLPTSGPRTTGVPVAVAGGVVSYPPQARAPLAAPLAPVPLLPGQAGARKGR